MVWEEAERRKRGVRVKACWSGWGRSMGQGGLGAQGPRAASPLPHPPLNQEKKEKRDTGTGDLFPYFLELISWLLCRFPFSKHVCLCQTWFAQSFVKFKSSVITCISYP